MLQRIINSDTKLAAEYECTIQSPMMITGETVVGIHIKGCVHTCSLQDVVICTTCMYKSCGEHLTSECNHVCQLICEMTLYHKEGLWFCGHEPAFSNTNLLCVVVATCILLISPTFGLSDCEDQDESKPGWIDS